MNNKQLAEQQPENIDEAIDCMRTTLAEFHECRDMRAVFLRLYYIMTLEVHAAIKGLGAYSGQTVFLDAPWVGRLSGKFASLYFLSLDTVGREPEQTVERAWKIAYKVAGAGGSTIVQDALLGMNAHINYDLARAIASNLDPGDLDDYSTLQRRKFDHDQVNNLLLRTLGPVQDVLAHDYGPGIGLADRLLGRFDEWLSETGLRYYRERVWWDALTFAAAAAEGREDVVRDKLNWESYKVALFLRTGGGCGCLSACSDCPGRCWGRRAGTASSSRRPVGSGSRRARPSTSCASRQGPYGRTARLNTAHPRGPVMHSHDAGGRRSPNATPRSVRANVRRTAMAVIVHAPLQPTTSTTELLRAAAAGDQVAWRELLHRFEPAVMSTIVAHRLQHADAHDAAQRTWLRMIEHHHEIREPEALGGWLRTTARHECLGIIRDRQRLEPLDAECAECRDTAVYVEQSVVDADTMERMRSLVNALPRAPQC
jgi:Family of unknown function (DUF5995)/Sigma-70 region 2